MSERVVNISGRGVSAYSDEAKRGHKCGKCANPFTHGNDECVNNKGRGDE